MFIDLQFLITLLGLRGQQLIVALYESPPGHDSSGTITGAISATQVKHSKVVAL
jgi:hypothetical protein